MKMLTSNSDVHYLNTLKALLESNGIAAVVQGENTARMILPRFGFQPTLWVYVDEQYQDALQLLDNPDYKVESPIDIEAFKEMEPDEFQQRKQLNAALRHLMLYLGVIMLGVIAIIWMLQ
ncbi:MAG: DUF2007 domain-containing protein [Candidatus Thiodiazotropha sp. L084R]